MAKNDETDLVDASQLPHEEEVTEARKRAIAEEAVTSPSNDIEPTEAPTDHAVDDPFAMQMEAAKPGQATIASLRERLAAFLVDVGFLWVLYWGCLFVFHKVTTHSWIGPVPTKGSVALFFQGAFLVIAFLYFFLLEAAFFATIGKFCCWMYVRRKDGRHAGALAIFIRNFFRLIELLPVKLVVGGLIIAFLTPVLVAAGLTFTYMTDYFLIAGLMIITGVLTSALLTWGPMELTHRHQRLGDMAAGTIVIKKHSASTHYYTLDADRLASAFGRLFAQSIDLTLAAIWLVGYVMLINYQSTLLSQWLVIAFPVVSILFWTLVQFILESTPGLWLLGYTITHEDGGQITFAGALIRVLLSPIDLLLGLPCMLLSLRKQKIGDMIAATVVSRQRRRWKGGVGSLAVIALTVGMVALGLFINPVNNVFKAGADFKLSFMPLVEGLPDWESASMAQPPILTVRNFRFGVNDPNTRRTPPVYEPSETVYLLFEIYGYARKDRMVWLQEDLMVQYPDGSIGLKQENVVDYHQIIKPGGGPIELTNNIALPPTAAPGTYVITITLRDLLANKFTVTETQSFTVKATPTMTSPLQAPPTPPMPSPLPVAPYGTPPPPVTPPTVEPQIPGTTTVPSSPIPVMPTAPGTVPTPAPAPAPPSPAGVPLPPSPPTPGATTTTTTVTTTAPTPATGFTVIPGPSIAPKEEVAPPATIPVPPMPTPPVTANQKNITTGVLPSDQYAKPITPLPTTPAVTPPTTATPVTPEKSAIVEKTLTPETKPVDAYAKPAVAAPAVPTKAPTDQYAKPAAAKTAAPAVTPPAKATPAPKATTPKPATEKTKAATPATPPKPGADTDIRKAAEKELQKVAPAKTPAQTPATTTPPVSKPASEIPSAEAVKKQAAQPATPKKKKSSGGGGGGGAGYMP